MTLRMSSFVLVALLPAVACAPRAGAPAIATAADTAAINQIRNREVAAVSTGDTTFGYMAADIVIMPPNEPAVVGVPAARTWFRDFLRQFRVSATYTESSIVFAGAWAIERNGGTLTVTPVAGGAAATDTFKGFHIYHRDAAGTWKLARDIWNSSNPLPAAR